MLNKATQKLIRSLDTRKGRRQEMLFVAEGPKSVEEMLQHFDVVQIVATSEWIAQHQHLNLSVEEVKEEELSRISLLQAPQQVLAIMRIPHYEASFSQTAFNELTLALDGVQDPGNLGTIIRVADWFGIHKIWCSLDTCDVWNPKVVQATMGSLARVQVQYIDLPASLAALPKTCAVYGTSLKGTNIYASNLALKGVVVMGNEGKGMSKAVADLCTHKILIPSFPVGSNTVESLNVAMATGIVLAEFRRQNIAASSCP